ncbi:MAG: hypothetical protein ACRCYL_03400, partial [Kluyvera sp.]
MILILICIPCTHSQTWLNFRSLSQFCAFSALLKTPGVIVAIPLHIRRFCGSFDLSGQSKERIMGDIMRPVPFEELLTRIFDE